MIFQQTYKRSGYKERMTKRKKRNIYIYIYIECREKIQQNEREISVFHYNSLHKAVAHYCFDSVDKHFPIFKQLYPSLYRQLKPNSMRRVSRERKMKKKIKRKKRTKAHAKFSAASMESSNIFFFIYFFLWLSLSLSLGTIVAYKVYATDTITEHPFIYCLYIILKESSIYVNHFLLNLRR